MAHNMFGIRSKVQQITDNGKIIPKDAILEHVGGDEFRLMDLGCKMSDEIYTVNSKSIENHKLWEYLG